MLNAASHSQRFSSAATLLFLFLIISFVGFSPAALSGGGLAEQEPSSEGDVATQLGFIFFFVAALGVKMPEKKFPTIPVGISIMLIWCAISLTWAIAPAIAVRRVVLLVIAVFVIFRFVEKIGVDQSLRVLSVALGVTIIIDMLAVAILPGARQIDYESQSLAWRGLHIDKNTAGPIAAAAVLIFLYRTYSALSLGMKVYWASLAFIAEIFLWGTVSKTSFAMMPIAGGIGFLLMASAQSRLARRVLEIGFIVLVALAIADRASIYQSLDPFLSDPDALTGRTQIWDVVLEYTGNHLWLGSGYGSFWAVGDQSPIHQYGDGWLFLVPNAHNGYLDMVAQTGLIGLVIAVLAAIVIPMRKLLLQRSLNFPTAWLLASIIVFATLHNFMESSLFNKVSPLWVILCYIIALITSAEKEGEVLHFPVDSSGSE